MATRGPISKALRRLVRNGILNPVRRLLARTVLRNQIPLDWHVERNWGDALNPLLARMISGREVYYANHSLGRRYIAIGSIMHYADAETEVWGSGFITPESTVVSPPRRIHAVRGPLTRRRLLDLGISCPEVYGDPALLLPRYLNPHADVRYAVGVIPHMIDKELPWVQGLLKLPLVKVIDVQGDLVEFVREVRSCRTILSSSLHGLVCADAYGIPSRWIKLSDSLVGGRFKFDDYYLGIGQQPRDPVVIDAASDVFEIAARAERIEVKADLDALLRACPFAPSSGAAGR